MKDPANRIVPSNQAMAVEHSDDHPLSLTRCTVCQHYKCYHDEKGCFLDPKGKQSRNPGILSRDALKASNAQCWCPKFLTSPGEAADLILELGNSEMLMRGAVEALNSGDPRNTRRLIDQYILKTPIDARDADWLRALERRLGMLISATPITEEDFQDFTKLPAKLKEASMDPIETNPFPEGHIAHDIWAKATRKASAEILSFRAEMLRSEPAAGGHDEWFLAMIVGQFDIWAKRFVHVVWTERMFSNFALWLVHYAEAWLDSCQQMKFPPCPLDAFLATARHRLMARTEWWKAEARRYLNLQVEKRDSEVSSQGRNLNSDIEHMEAKTDTNVKPHHRDGPSPTASTKASERTSSTSKKPLMVKYRSGIKRAILGAIMKNPNASDADVCRLLDADGGEELPAGWKGRGENRSFFDAYSNLSARRKIEIAISKIRRDLRDRGLLP